MAAKTVHSSDSRSLWNYTLSPGWTAKETEVLSLALQKWGVGSWRAILREKVLPGKTTAQIVNQTQRMVGQQSLAEFNGLNLRLKEIFEKNAARSSASRKGGIIINSGNNPTREEIDRKIAHNKEMYGLTAEEIAAIVVPTLSHEDTSAVLVDSSVQHKASLHLAKMERLEMLEKRLKALKDKLAEVVANGEVSKKGKSTGGAGKSKPSNGKGVLRASGGKLSAASKGAKAAKGAKGKGGTGAKGKGATGAKVGAKAKGRKAPRKATTPTNKRKSATSKKRTSAPAGSPATESSVAETAPGVDDDMLLALKLQMEEQNSMYGVEPADDDDDDFAPGARRKRKRPTNRSGKRLRA